MEPEKYRPRPSPLRQKEFRKEPEVRPQSQVVKKNYSQEVSVVLGFTFVIVGLLGFVMPYFLNAHLSYAHNTIHVLSGALALWFGFQSNNAAKRFCYVFGPLYALLGVLGFLIGSPGIASIANPVEDRFLWRAIPEVLELGSVDHTIHIIAGVAFLLAALVTVSVKSNKETFFN